MEGEHAKGWRVVAQVTVTSVKDNTIVVKVTDAKDRKRLKKKAEGLFLAWVP